MIDSIDSAFSYHIAFDDRVVAVYLHNFDQQPRRLSGLVNVLNQRYVSYLAPVIGQYASAKPCGWVRSRNESQPYAIFDALVAHGVGLAMHVRGGMNVESSVGT